MASNISGASGAPIMHPALARRLKRHRDTLTERLAAIRELDAARESKYAADMLANRLPIAPSAAPTTCTLEDLERRLAALRS